MNKEAENRRFGSAAGLVISLAVGFAFYLIMQMIGGSTESYSYANIVDGIADSVPKQIQWFFMDFTEAQFYAGVCAGAGVIVGGAVAWILAVKGSKYAGFDVCYGSSTMFPWVLASQVISLALAIFVFRYIDLFRGESVTWAATFITVVGAPPAVMLLYGPSVSALLTSSVLGGLICAPTATWIGNQIITPLGLPGVVGNVLTMAITGIIVCMVCKAAPWVEKKEIKPHKSCGREEDVYSASWFVRRVLAEFTEAPFYGNEVASLFVLAGAVIDWVVCSTHGANGAGAVPAIILSQFTGAAVGVFLYARKFENGGWYATYVPVVSVGPACVLVFGSSIPVALFAGALGGVLGGPVAEFFAGKLPEGVHVTVANVTSMAICTAVTAIVMQILPFF